MLSTQCIGKGKEIKTTLGSWLLDEDTTWDRSLPASRLAAVSYGSYRPEKRGNDMIVLSDTWLELFAILPQGRSVFCVPVVFPFFLSSFLCPHVLSASFDFPSFHRPHTHASYPSFLSLFLSPLCLSVCLFSLRLFPPICAIVPQIVCASHLVLWGLKTIPWLWKKLLVSQKGVFRWIYIFWKFLFKSNLSVWFLLVLASKAGVSKVGGRNRFDS